VTTDDERPADPAPVDLAEAGHTSTDAAPADGVPTDAAPADGVPTVAAPTDGVPDEATLAEIARPARVRRAPRFGAFIRAGVVLGAVVGWIVAMVASGTSGEARTAAVLISTVGVAALGALISAGVAAIVDRRSGRR